MAWYWWLLIIVGIVSLITWSVIEKRKDAQKKYEEFIADISTWKVGDRLSLHSKEYMETAKRYKMSHPKLIKWDEENVIVDLGDNMHTLIQHWQVKENIDDFWRMKYASMNKFMRSINKLADYKAEQKNEEGEVIESKMDLKVDEDGNVSINDMPVEGMSEVHLTIFLKYAIEEKNFKLAERLREELKKWR